MIRALIADNQELIRSSIQVTLEANSKFKVTVTVADGEEVLDAIERERPDVISVDVKMPKMNGTVCTKYVKSKYPGIKVIISVTFGDDDFIFSALKYGVSDYLLKGAPNDQPYQAVEAVYQRGAMINPNIAEKIFELFSKMAQSNYVIRADQTESEHLSKNEWRVIQQMGLGLSNREISVKLYLSEGTARNYISSVLGQLDLRDHIQLVTWAIQTGVAPRDFGE